MTKNKVFKKGFFVELESYEGDGDHYKTESFTYTGPAGDLARLQKFLNDNCRDEYDGEEMQEPWEDADLQCFSDCASDWLGDHLGYTNYGERRQMDSMKVYLVPETIIIEAVKL